jgi:hypothetical protein
LEATGAAARGDAPAAGSADGAGAAATLGKGWDCGRVSRVRLNKLSPYFIVDLPG